VEQIVLFKVTNVCIMGKPCGGAVHISRINLVEIWELHYIYLLDVHL